MGHPGGGLRRLSVRVLANRRTLRREYLDWLGAHQQHALSTRIRTPRARVGASGRSSAGSPAAGRMA